MNQASPIGSSNGVRIFSATCAVQHGHKTRVSKAASAHVVLSSCRISSVPLERGLLFS